LADCVVALCLLVTARTLHYQMALGAGAVQRAYAAWPDKTMQLQKGLLRSKRHGMLGAGRV